MSKKETLHEIGLRCGTDKATFHNYCVVYDEYLAPLRNKKVKVFYDALKWEEPVEKENTLERFF